MRTKAIQFLTALAATLPIATSALADDTGSAGAIVRLERNTIHSDIYLAYHGRVFLRGLDGVVTEYRWGGVACGNRTLTDGEFATLQAAQSNKKMLVHPLTQLGQGNSKCIVGIHLLEKKNLALFE